MPLWQLYIQSATIYTFVFRDNGIIEIELERLEDEPNDFERKV